MTERLDYIHIAPAGARALGGVYGYITQSKLPATLINLVYLRVSQINNCFEERELVDLTIAIGLMNAYNRLAISFRNTPKAAIEMAA
jgi:alkylhydroperoxidase family enzyme